jgi:hypothetical protein
VNGKRRFGSVELSRETGSNHRAILLLVVGRPARLPCRSGPECNWSRGRYTQTVAPNGAGRKGATVSGLFLRPNLAFSSPTGDQAHVERSPGESVSISKSQRARLATSLVAGCGIESRLLSWTFPPELGGAERRRLFLSGSELRASTSQVVDPDSERIRGTPCTVLKEVQTELYTAD